METALGAALSDGHPELAMALIRVLAEENAEIRTHYFWPIIIHYGKQGDSQSKNVSCGVEYLLYNTVTTFLYRLVDCMLVMDIDCTILTFFNNAEMCRLPHWHLLVINNVNVMWF